MLALAGLMVPGLIIVTQALTLSLAGVVLGMAGLAVSLMVVRIPRASFQLPLGALLSAIAVLVCPILVAELAPGAHTFSIAIGLVAVTQLGPLLWFYVKALTSEVKWRFRRRDAVHFVPALAGLLIIVGLGALSPHQVDTMLLRGQLPEGGLPALLALLAWLLLLFWAPQSCYYLIRSARWLFHYRSLLRNMFSNTEQREMSWLTILIVMLGVIWILAIAAIVASNLFDFALVGRGGVTVMALAAVWVLSVCGLGQAPGYEGHYGSKDVVATDSSPAEKYRRSALDSERSRRIADKIERAMAIDRLYLNSDLTLTDLAGRLGVAPNHVSQTLNETMGESFFDYVNRKRVEAAQQLLLNSDRSALDIAYEVGFNARSSFYKAFRRAAGITPGEYRQSANGPGFS